MSRALACGLATALACAAAAPARAQKTPLRLAVMDFQPASTAPDYDALGVGLQSMITTDLASVPAFTLVERARLKDVVAELHLGASGLVDKATAAKIGSLAGATHLLTGSFTVVGDKMRIDARLFTVATGEIVAAEKMEGAATTFFDLEKALVKRVVDAVGVKLTRAQKGELQKPATTDLEAFQKYSQGLVAADAKQLDEAVADMQAAVARDPGFTLAATHLADFQRLLASLPPPPPPETQCRPNPAFSGCSQPGTPPPAPMSFTAGDNRQFGVSVRANGIETRCQTPCMLHLPPGRVELQVSGPVQYTRSLDVPPGPATVVVNGRNRINLILGLTLSAIGLAATGVTIGLYESNTSSSSSQAFEFWPLTFGVAMGLAFPAVYYSTRIGDNDARVVRLGGPAQ